jgi:peptidoglycan/LPS O-acetylase OafA/YrhL
MPSDPIQAEGRIWRCYLGLDTRADALLIGCLTGLLVTWQLLPVSPLFQRAWRAVAAAAAATLFCIVWKTRTVEPILARGGFTVIALLFASVIIALMFTRSRAIGLLLESRPLVGIGRISYALYLFHWPIIFWLCKWPFPAHRKQLLITAISIGAAVLSYYAVERPCLRLKDRFRDLPSSLPSRPARVATSSGVERQAA